MNFFEQVYEVVKKIPEGKVATYGQIAALCGSPRASRQVGWALHANPYEGIVPCHRVVNRLGMLCEGFVFGGADCQKRLLESEGITVDKENKLDLEKYRWDNI